MKRRSFTAPRPVRERKPCEILGFADCLQRDCCHWTESRSGASCSWTPAADRQTQEVRS